MKKLTLIGFVIALTLFHSPSHAQGFLNKLTKKAGDAAKKAVTKKAGNKATKSDASLDDIDIPMPQPKNPGGDDIDIPMPPPKNPGGDDIDIPMPPESGDELFIPLAPPLHLKPTEKIINAESCSNFYKDKNLKVFVIKDSNTKKFRMVTINENGAGSVVEDTPDLTEQDLKEKGVLNCKKETKKKPKRIEVKQSDFDQPYTIVWEGDNSGPVPITTYIPGTPRSFDPIASNKIACIPYTDFKTLPTKTVLNLSSEKQQEYYTKMAQAPLNLLVLRGKKQEIIKNVPKNATFFLDESGEHILYTDNNDSLYVDGIQTGKGNFIMYPGNQVFIGKNPKHWAYFNGYSLKFHNGVSIRYALMPAYVEEDGKSYVKCYAVKRDKSGNQTFGFIKKEL